MGEVTGVDKAQRCVFVSDADREHVPVRYDYLILATGARHSYFGHNEFEKFAPGLKSVANSQTANSSSEPRPPALACEEEEEFPAGSLDFA